MGPKIVDTVSKDEFVLTISDNDTSYPIAAETDDSSTEAPPKQLPNGIKRKRDSVEPPINGKSKKQKKQRKGQKIQTSNEEVISEDEDQTWAAGGKNDGAMDSDFEFQIGNIDDEVVEDFDAWDLEGDSVGKSNGNKKGVNIEELIARRRKGADEKKEPPDIDVGDAGLDGSDESEVDAEEQALAGGQMLSGSESEEEDETLAEDGFGMGATGNDEEDDEEEDKSDEASDDGSIAEPVPHPDDQATDNSSAEEEDDPEEQARRDAFFAPSDIPKTSTNTSTFHSMRLARPILRALTELKFITPTPIQQKAIPIALLGRDIVGGAVTGSGKTAAFLIPILDRLLYRPKKVPTSRVAILMPTRELALQCREFAQKLVSHLDISVALLIGGGGNAEVRRQEAELRTRPDIIIATPGRFIDHMRNTASFTIDTLEILVLDEADRMLEDGFADELNEILTTIPRSRQTMLFSATMTSRVDALIRLGLQRPVRLVINPQKHTTVGTLVQEFVRLRQGREEKRLAYLLHLCLHTYTSRVIIFFRQKALAHRTRILFALFDLRAAELHGSMTQEQRIAALTSFRAGDAHYLLATDVASRGLDIPSVTTVINYSAPQTSTIYLHRVGRTARAGRAGRACTLAAEPDRKVVKEIVRAARSQGAKIVSRAVDAAAIDALHTRIEALDGEIDAVLQDEKSERALSGAEMRIRKGENLMRFEDEIRARPQRTWFESEREKKAAKQKSWEELNGVKIKMGGGEGKGKLSGKDKKRLDDRRERKEGVVWRKGKGDVRGGPERGNGGKKAKGKGKGKGGEKAGKGGAAGGKARSGKPRKR